MPSRTRIHPKNQLAIQTALDLEVRHDQHIIDGTSHLSLVLLLRLGNGFQVAFAQEKGEFTALTGGLP